MCTQYLDIFVDPSGVFLQLEFSLLALRDDPLPALQAQISAAQQAGNHGLEDELLARLSNESSKRERWAVSGNCRLLANVYVDPSHIVRK